MAKRKKAVSATHEITNAARKRAEKAGFTGPPTTGHPPGTRTSKIIIHSTPAELKQAIADAVDAGEHRSMNDAIRAKLSEAFNVRYDAPAVPENGIESVIDVGAPKVSLTIDERLDRKIENEAHRQRTSKRNVIVEVLSDAFGVRFVPTGRWVHTR